MRFVRDWLLPVGIVLALVGVLMFGAVTIRERRFQAFMAECMADNQPHYRCWAMWRGGGRY